MRKRQLQKEEFTWKFARNPFAVSTEGVTLEFGGAFFVGYNIEFELLEIGRVIFNDIVDDFAIKSTPLGK